MKTLLKIFLFFLLIPNLNAQNIGWTTCDCIELINTLVDSQTKKGGHQKALENLKLAFALKPYLLESPHQKQRLAFAYARADSLTQALNLIRETYPILNNKAFIEINLYESGLKETPELDSILELPKETAHHLNTIYQDKLDTLYQNFNRIHYRNKEKLSVEEIRWADSLNWLEIHALIEEFGFPDFQHHGFTRDYLTVFIAQNLRYTGFLRNEALLFIESDTTCLFKKAMIGRVYDNVLSLEEHAQQFGTQLFYDKLHKPILNPAAVDSLRFEYNLPTLYDSNPYLNFPENYKRWSYPPGYFCGALE